MRPIRFRGKRIDNAEWVYGSLNLFDCKQGTESQIVLLDGTFYKVIPETVGQYTEHQLKVTDLYEGDIIRLEENEDGVDPADQMTYYVVVWIKEWCMFAILRASDEYAEYLSKGVDGIEADMFWTFPLDTSDTTTSKHFLCGNILDNPELLSLNTVK